MDRFTELDLSKIRTAGILGAVLDLFIIHICSGVKLFLESRSINHQRFDRTARLSVALESAVKSQSGICLLRPSADHCNDLSRAVVNAHSSSLHLVLPVIRRLLKISQFFVHTVLKHLLFLKVKSCIYPVAALEQFGKT